MPLRPSPSTTSSPSPRPPATGTCAPPDGEPLFLPLTDLFEHPPEGDHVDTEFGLRVDNTWGHGKPESGSDDDPNAAAFEFYVLAGPDEVHTSLDRRDGSHWALFNCHDAAGEAEHVVQMVCTDDSERSNCGAISAGAISAGAGVPGTIIRMPQGQGCGLGKYAVAKSLSPAANQTLPEHLARRGLDAIYDLAFDYDFSRVPRGFGDTQLRVDYSNQEGYWGRILREQWECETKRARYEARLDAVATAAIRVSTYLQAAADDLGPKALSRPGRAFDTRGLRPPSFKSVGLRRGAPDADAELRPRLDASWQVGRCAVELIADGWVRMRARSDLGCGFGFGVDAGADLRVQGVAPDALD